MTNGTNESHGAAPSAAPVSDAELVGRVRAGDAEAFGELFRRHRPASLRLALVSTDRATAEDVVSDTFERLLNTLRAGGGPDFAVRPYVLAMVRNGVIDTRRRRYDDPVDPLVADGTPSPLDSVEPDHSPELAERSVAHQALMGLSERWRAVLWLGEVEGLDRHEIAAALGITAEAVSALAFRAREGLRVGYLAAHAGVASNETCRQVTELLPEFVRGRTSPQQTALVEEHLPGCDACAGATRELAVLNTHLAGFLAPALLGATGLGYLQATQQVATGAAVLAAGRAGVRTVRRVALAGTGVAAAVLAGWLALDGPGTSTPVASPPSTPDAAAVRTVSRDAATPVVAVPAPTRTPEASPTAPAVSRPATPPPSRTTVPRIHTVSPARTTPKTPTTPTTATTPTEPGTTPTPVSPTTGPSTPRTTEDLSLGAPTFQERPDPAMRYHLTLPVDLGHQDQAVLTVTVSELTAFATHTDGAFGPWRCQRAAEEDGAPAQLRCTLPTGASTSTLGLDLASTAGATLSATLTAPGNDDPDPSNNAVTAELPELP